VNGLILWLAQGFGVGRIPFAPGTAGSLVGLLWFALLLATGNPAVFIAGTIAGLAASVWLCGRAENILKQTDPPSVVLDEIAAMPLCFALWVEMEYHWTDILPSPELFFFRRDWPVAVGIFLAFRLFDIWKPWPIRQSQKLPGGWGVVIDDLLAAVYVNICWFAFVFLWMRLVILPRMRIQ
jgi:phosphatidylglycerophosphatase A